jgi:hypothetical protein
MTNFELTLAVVAGAFAFGFFFSLGVAIASRILPVKSLREMTYDNLEKPNSPKSKKW